MLQIKIKFRGRINQQWSGWFDGLAISYSNRTTTIITGIVTDQSALYGIISHLRDLGLQLISVKSEEIKEDSNGRNE
jgi:hypothetical protein